MHSQHIRNDINKGTGGKNHHEMFGKMKSVWYEENACILRKVVKQACFKLKRNLLVLLGYLGSNQWSDFPRFVSWKDHIYWNLEDWLEGGNPGGRVGVAQLYGWEMMIFWARVFIMRLDRGWQIYIIFKR